MCSSDLHLTDIDLEIFIITFCINIGEAQICGVISGIIAATVGYIGYHAISPQLESYGINITPISNILETNWLFVVYLIIIAIGFLIGTISSSLAIRRYLNATAKRTKRRKKKKSQSK